MNGWLSIATDVLYAAWLFFVIAFHIALIVGLVRVMIVLVAKLFEAGS